MNNNNKSIAKYTAEFDKYSISEQQEVFMHFINVKDDRGNLIRECLDIVASTRPDCSVKDLIGNIMIGSIVSFSAHLVVDSSCDNGCDLTNISEIKQLNQNSGGDDE